ncbi:M3 family oligoendopeptidase [Anaeromicropila herbilytica]|uniref:Oligoendopeptidase F n=1 Tax=Anaeromicropila herbilytica TaxID=2785025 RepID=A0A7R7EK01_9FIRM|nr:M3 family oligoendopeptidase [Anaeromicropila herbilytica]BCN30178.1 oligoendopeptidase F [Anaeromicropila herbilytica]
MNREWSLDILYKDFKDEKYINDFKRFEDLASEMNTLSNSLADKAKNEETLILIIEKMEEFSLLITKLYSYAELRQATNTTDNDAVSQISAILKLNSSVSKANAMINKYIASYDNLEEIIEKNAFLKEYEFFLKEIKENSKYLLSDDVEEVISKLNLSAGASWNNMQSFLTSTLEVDYDGKIVTLPEIRNLAYNKDKNVRKAAYEAELKAYNKIKDAISFSLNNIKVQVNTISELRGYESPLAMTLKLSKMKKETLNALLEAMKEYMPKFHLYLRRKAELLGYKNGLPWFELFAPIGESDRKFTTEEARDYLLNHFSSFSQDIADLMKEAFDNEWIDFYPKKGKVGGAFCANMSFVKQSRVLTNFDGSLSDVVTLAHELGHAYHGKMIETHRPLNWEYSMPVAETASTFNETVVMNAAIKEASDKEKIALIESQLQDTTQIICDIYSRFLFESAVFEKSKTEFLFADSLEQMMLDAQKEAYGDGLDSEFLHPYMWVNKSHYYSEALSFYNFPYAFGGLFARGLYEKYMEEGETFLPKYQALLKATTVSTVEDAAKEAGIDLENPEFFRKSLQSFGKLIDEFLELTK